MNRKFGQRTQAIIELHTTNKYEKLFVGPMHNNSLSYLYYMLNIIDKIDLYKYNNSPCLVLKRYTRFKGRVEYNIDL